MTLTEVASRPIQTWIRTVGTVDKTGKTLTTFLRAPESDLVRIGRDVSVLARTVLGVFRRKDGIGDAADRDRRPAQP